MLILLGYLFGEEFRLWLMEEAEDLHTRAKYILYWMGILVVVAIGLNLVGAKAINFYLGIILNIAALVVFTCPSILLAIFGVGAITNQNSFSLAGILNNGRTGGKEMLAKAAQSFSLALIYLSTFFLLSGFLSYGNNPTAIPMILLAIILLFWIDVAGWFKVAFLRRGIYLFAIWVAIFGLLSFIPRAGYIKTMGFYPYAFLQTTALEEQISNLENTETETRENATIKQLKLIEAKIKKGESLTNRERNASYEAKKERNRASVPGSLKKAFQKWGAAEASGTPTVLIKPVGLGKGIHLINQNAGELSGWKEPEGAGKLRVNSADEGYLLIMSDGTKIPSSNIASYTGGPFRFYAITDQRQSSIIIED